MPAPFGPMRPTISPWPHRKRDVVDGADAAEAHRQALHGEHGLDAGGARRRCGCSGRRPDGRRRATVGRTAARLDGQALLGALQEHRPQQSGRSSSSAVGPWKRISPFSMKYAVSARVRATLTDCSTSMTVVPWSRIASHHVQQLLDDHRGQPERQLVDDQQLRLG